LVVKVGRQMQWLMANRSVPQTEEWQRRQEIALGHSRRLDRQLLFARKTLLDFGWAVSDRGDWYQLTQSPTEPRWTPCERRMLETFRALGRLLGTVPAADLERLDRIVTEIDRAVGANDAAATDRACDAYEAFAQAWINGKLELD